MSADDVRIFSENARGSEGGTYLRLRVDGECIPIAHGRDLEDALAAAVGRIDAYRQMVGESLDGNRFWKPSEPITGGSLNARAARSIGMSLQRVLGLSKDGPQDFQVALDLLVRVRALVSAALEGETIQTSNGSYLFDEVQS